MSLSAKLSGWKNRLVCSTLIVLVLTALMLLPETLAGARGSVAALSGGTLVGSQAAPPANVNLKTAGTTD